MARWQRQLELGDIMSAVRKGSTTLPQAAGEIAARLKAVRRFPADPDINEARDDIVQLFRDYAADGLNDVEDFDGILSELYDWADTPLDGNYLGRKVCWIST